MAIVCEAGQLVERTAYQLEPDGGQKVGVGVVVVVVADVVVMIGRVVVVVVDVVVLGPVVVVCPGGTGV